MRIITTLDEMIRAARGWLVGGPVGFVPTMGSLHEGHRSLIQAASEECEICVVSIFVNPLQFPTAEEVAQYPRQTAQDFQLLNSTNVDVVFIPRTDDIYPETFSTYVTLRGPLAERLEAVQSESFVRGVATVMIKLLQIIRPDVVYLGQKDAQQVAIVRHIVRDFDIDVKLRILPTVREADGLAISSRNAFLTPAERSAASALYAALLVSKALVESGERNPQRVEQAMLDQLRMTPLITPEYVAVCNPATFAAVQEIVPGTLFALAAHIGEIRLIDNILWMDDGHWRL